MASIVKFSSMDPINVEFVELLSNRALKISRNPETTHCRFRDLITDEIIIETSSVKEEDIVKGDRTMTVTTSNTTYVFEVIGNTID